MLISAPLLDELLRRLAAASGPLRMATVAIDLDPISFVRAGASSFQTAGYFGMPGGLEIGGLGVSWQARTSGPQRLGGLQAAVEAAQLPEDVHLLTGFAFSDDGPRGDVWAGFAGATALLPTFTVTAGPDGGSLTAAIPAGRDPRSAVDALRGLHEPPRASIPEAAAHVIESIPSPGEWRDAVAEAVAAIGAGAFSKVVLARSVSVRGAPLPDPFGIVQQLRAGHAEFYSFGWQEGDAVFLGASPELLVAREGNKVRSHPFAGTVPRGRDEDEDAALGQSLMASSKNRSEHRIVVDDIVSRLRHVTGALSTPGTPSLRRMPNYHHLSTEISGRVRSGASILEIARLLHPTPAVGGSPRDALAFLDKLEAIDRGWYAGGIGWSSPSGDGEIALGLRCALVRGAEARLFAGNGIVADSDPEVELAETRLKLQALLDLLAAT